MQGAAPIASRVLVLGALRVSGTREFGTAIALVFQRNPADGDARRGLPRASLAATAPKVSIRRPARHRMGAV